MVIRGTVMNEDIKFEYIAFGFYRVIRNSVIFVPEAFILLSSNGISYKRVGFNFWRKR